MFIGNHAEEASCNINSVVLENVESFQYLGRVITNSNNDTKAVGKLISKGWNAYNKVKTVLKHILYHALCMVQKQNVEKRST